MAIIYGEVLSEGEKKKVIQNPQNNTTNIDQPVTEDSEDQQAPEKESEPHWSPKSTNSVHFPMSEELQNDPDPEPQDTSQPSNQQYGRGQQARPEKGHYKAMNKGLVAAITAIVQRKMMSMINPLYMTWLNLKMLTMTMSCCLI